MTTIDALLDGAGRTFADEADQLPAGPGAELRRHPARGEKAVREDVQA
jgi:hypothetical protein